MIMAAGFGKVVTVKTADAVRFFGGSDPKFESIKRLTGPAAADVIDLWLLIDPSMAWPKEIERARRPAIALVSDDPGTPHGQGGAPAWRCARRLRDWTRAAIIHGAGAEPEQYCAVMQAALKLGRATLIETTSVNLPGWIAALRCPRALIIAPRGGVHPVQQEAA